MPEKDITFQLLDGDQAAGRMNELGALYREVYAEPPYGWGNEHATLFAERFEVQRNQPGFALIEGRQQDSLTGFCFGVTLQPSTPWWQHLLAPLPADVITEYPGRTLAIVELVVRAPWRRQHIAQTMHDMLLQDRPEQRATLTVLPAALPAQQAYAKWGWRTVAQKRNPLPGSPVFDVLIKELRAPDRS